ncbi:MAG TPA: hypothetical protein VGM21_07600 [Actinomycetota bacterium]
MQKKSSFPASLWLAAVAVVVVLPAAAGPPSPDPLAAIDPPTTAVLATSPPTTAPPTTGPPTTAPPATSPPTTAPPATSPPTTAPPATSPPTTAPPATRPPTTAPPARNPPTTAPAAPRLGGTVATGRRSVSRGDGGPAAAFKSSVDAIGSTAGRAVMPAVRKLARTPAVRGLAESQPVAATKEAVARATEELGDLKPARIVPYLWLALVALLLTTGAFLRLWWAPPDWPSFRSLAVGAHRSAGQRPRRPARQVGWPASPRPAPSREGGWRPATPAANGLAARRPPHRVGIDVGRLRSGPPPRGPVFTGQHDRDPRG